MNLHEVGFALTNVAIWIQAIGRNGRHNGTHLWRIEEGTPPDLMARPTYATTYWRQPRYEWRPFKIGIANLFNNGYIAPLCGKVSRSRRPWAREALEGEISRSACEACAAAAWVDGILPMSRVEGWADSAIYRATQEEVLTLDSRGQETEWTWTTGATAF